MGTVPTGGMERELRRLYLRWVTSLPGLSDQPAVSEAIRTFQLDSLNVVARMGGRVAALGALAGFPAPRLLDLSLHVGTIYSDIDKAAIRASIALGLGPAAAARAMFRAGSDKSFSRLLRLARTETVSAYWKNAWDSASGLDLVMVWSAERGPRTCKWCLERDGLVVEDPNIRDHPNGRCTIVPRLPELLKYKGTLMPDSGREAHVEHTDTWDPLAIPVARSTAAPVYRDADWRSGDLPDVLTRTAAAKAYVGEGYADMNMLLRRGEVLGATPAQTRKLQAHVDSLTADLRKGVTTEDLTVYRGIRGNGAAKIFGLNKGMFGKATYEELSGQVGAVFTDKGFTSTWAKGGNAPTDTLFADKADVLFNVRLPAGTRGSKLTISDRDEDEFLLPPGATFVVTGVRKNGAQTVMDIVLTSQEG